ncbi:MAG: DNA polymerase III subunit gamma/tau [Bosea sp. (in: a-proteobacteria)]
MVRTLTNAFAAGRIPQAWMLTGVRGVGKTTTARILARGLNFQRADGTGGPTTDLKERGVHCDAIIEGRHIDIMEIDAASNNGVDNVRQINDAVRYAPVSARYKVYIIDEVHMLSGGAFNAFLKTLEEPPPHAKFIFATTEIRKVPVTVLSRCQRFDLRRVDAGLLVNHLTGICQSEGVSADEEALAAISRAAEGSVRDSLSILDQAIAHADGQITLESVRDMLGLADRARVVDLFEAVMRGDLARALGELRSQYDGGADPVTVLNDLAEFSHLVTRLKLVPEAAKDPALTQVERTRGAEFAQALSIRVLARAWQMLLKGIHEVKLSDRPVMAAEMVLVRLAHAADLPTPDEAMRIVREGGGQGSMSGQGSASAAPSSGSQASQQSPRPTYSASGSSAALASRPALHSVPASTDAPPWTATQTAAARAQQAPTPQVHTLADLVALASQHRDVQLKVALERDIRLVRLEPGRIEFALAPNGPRQIANDLSRKLKEWTGQTWLAVIVNEQGEATLREQAEEKSRQREDDAASHPAVRAVLERFPGARIIDVRDPNAVTREAIASAAPEVFTDADGAPLEDDSEPFDPDVEF